MGGRRWAAVVIVACALGVTGCTGDSDGAEPTPTTASSTTVGPTDTTTPTGPVEPTVPAEAQGGSAAAAKAFVGYYIELLNYAMVTGDTEAFRAAAPARLAVAATTMRTASRSSLRLADPMRRGVGDRRSVFVN